LIDRFKRRSREYIEIQKKTQQILSATDGFHFSIYANNPLSKELQQQKQRNTGAQHNVNPTQPVAT
jgi:hypothetical protein